MLAALVVSGCGDPAQDGSVTKQAARTNVLLVSIDSLRADHLKSFRALHDFVAEDVAEQLTVFRCVDH